MGLMYWVRLFSRALTFGVLVFVVAAAAMTWAEQHDLALAVAGCSGIAGFLYAAIERYYRIPATRLESFFELGGDPLTAADVARRLSIRKGLGGNGPRRVTERSVYRHLLYLYRSMEIGCTAKGFHRINKPWPE